MININTELKITKNNINEKKRYVSSWKRKKEKLPIQYFIRKYPKNIAH